MSTVNRFNSWLFEVREAIRQKINQINENKNSREIRVTREFFVT